ncbi:MULTISPECIES: thioredoxin family protein [Halomicrobium]|uniref:Redoxin domain protein n=2 Tax=Halomicrobium mukohataei TaxID=57705 RepID=C7NWQ5_HALMD|nr:MULTISPECIES: thioredoxin family protein [Halomicrobium]ACV48265.1 Redoxin domain protein [Halomicrobium mukohataei DSM 12286]QCD66684.1 thioredoxin family protein [Halomicrobium mukohataei]QFR21490.1 redoxin family protein [Halomicrobium sp. ZPS1]
MVALDSEDDVLQRGDEAPVFELPGTDGESYTLDAFADREALLVVFTCNHCPYAQAKFDELNHLAAEYDEVAVVGINANDPEEYPDDSFEKMRELVDDGTVDYDAYLFDESQEIAAAYGARCTPDPFLFVDDGGTFRLAYHGRLDDATNPDDEPTEREMKAHIETLLAGEEITAEAKPSRGCSIKWKPGNEPDYWDA